MLKLKLQSFDHLMRITDSFEKALILGKTGGRRKNKVGWDQSLYYKLKKYGFKQQRIRCMF